LVIVLPPTPGALRSEHGEEPEANYNQERSVLSPSTQHSNYYGYSTRRECRWIWGVILPHHLQRDCSLPAL